MSRSVYIEARCKLGAARSYSNRDLRKQIYDVSHLSRMSSYPTCGSLDEIKRMHADVLPQTQDAYSAGSVAGWHVVPHQWLVL